MFVFQTFWPLTTHFNDFLNFNHFKGATKASFTSLCSQITLKPSENFVTNIFSFSSSPPNEGGVFAWWCGAGPELDHLYQFVSDYSHQVIVQLTYQQTAKQDGLPRANYFCHRMLISNEDGYRWKIHQLFKGALKMRHSMLQTLGM